MSTDTYVMFLTDNYPNFRATFTNQATDEIILDKSFVVDEPEEVPAYIGECFAEIQKGLAKGQTVSYQVVLVDNDTVN